MWPSQELKRQEVPELYPKICTEIVNPAQTTCGVKNAFVRVLYSNQIIGDTALLSPSEQWYDRYEI